LSDVVTKTPFAQEIDVALGKFALLVAFEQKHRQFLLTTDCGYFLSDYAVVFLHDGIDDVKRYFGADGWRLASHTGAVERTVDGVVVRLILPHDNGFTNQELTI
jgi:hypothetical protein